MGLSDETIMRTVEAVQLHGSGRQAALALDIARSTVRDHIQKALARNLIDTAPPIPGFEVTRISTTQDADGNVKSQSIQQKPETEKSAFHMPDGHALRGVSALLDENGDVKQQWVKTDRKAQEAFCVVDAAKEAFAGLVGASELIDSPKDIEKDHVSVIPLVDWHIGLMSWAEETGENYDLKIAENVIMDAMNDKVIKPSHYVQYEIEPITFIMKNGMEFWRGNIIKYASRAGSKLYEDMDAVQSEITDLEKVRRYAEMRINELKGESIL